MSEYEELQKKQLFAQRAAAVAAAATAAAAASTASSTAATAESIERMRREALLSALASQQHQSNMEEAQEAQLAVIKEQAQAEAEDRKYQRQVLFLKESDDPTKFETYLEMLKGRLNTIYVDPPLPKECQEDGVETLNVKAAEALKPQDEEQPESSQLAAVKGEINGLSKKLSEMEKDEGDSKVGCGLLIVMGIFAVYVINNAEHWIIKTLIFFFVIAVVTHQIFEKKKPKIEREKGLIKTKLEDLNVELKRLSDEAESNKAKVKAEADKKYLATLGEALGRWREIAFRALMNDYFTQDLWIDSVPFTQHLRATLTEAQRLFPTSCRVDVNKLSEGQIETAYNMFTEEVAGRMCKRSILISAGDELAARMATILRRKKSFKRDE